MDGTSSNLLTTRAKVWKLLHFGGARESAVRGHWNTSVMRGRHVSMRMRTAVMTGVLALAGTLAANAQNAQAAPECRNLRYRSNFRLNGAQQYLARARSATYPDQKRAALNDATRVLNEAVTDHGADQATLWYLFGEAYSLRGDLVGADSAWAKTQAVTDQECRQAIQRERFNLWVPLVQEGGGLASSSNYDSALVLLRRANAIYREDPRGYFTMAQTFYVQAQALTDSASSIRQRDTSTASALDARARAKYDSTIAYFRRASTAGTDPQTADIRATAGMNAVRLAQQENQLPLADSLIRDYLRVRPQEVDAVTRLASILTAEGRTADAAHIYDSLLARADSLAPEDLFDLGVTLFNQQRPRDAARAFAANVRKSPYDRNAQYNLANAYLSADDTARTLEAAKRLAAIDPNNRQSLRLVAGAYQRIGMGLRDQAQRAQTAHDTATAHRLRPIVLAYQDSTLKALARSDSLVWELNIARFDPRDTSAVIQGQVRNLQQAEHAGFTLVLEFVNAAGDVVATERVEIPALNQEGNPGSAYDFNLTVNGRGILAYRYRQG